MHLGEKAPSSPNAATFTQMVRLAKEPNREPRTANPRPNTINSMLLAGDVGGTKALLGLYEPHERRPVPVATQEFATLEHAHFEAILQRFLGGHGVSADRIEAASFGVAGAVTNQVAQLTNVPWCIDAADLAAHAHLRNVRLLNDLEAMAYGVPVL